MKKIALILMLLLVSCYKEVETNPNHPEEYLGIWTNEKTLINGIPDDIHPYNKVPHYVFQIAQSEITLSTSSSIGSKYQNWKIDKTSEPYKLLLYKNEFTATPNLVFVIKEKPYFGEMQITYQDSILYYLKK